MTHMGHVELVNPRYHVSVKVAGEPTMRGVFTLGWGVTFFALTLTFAHVPEVAAGVVTLVLTICLLSAPEKCREERFQLGDQVTLTQCMSRSVMYVAQWSEQHPAFRVTKWRCELPKVEQGV